MKSKALLTLLLLSSSLFATEAPNPQEEDLFNQHEQSFLVNGEFIYWTVSEGSLDYSHRMNASTPSNGTLASGSARRAQFDWNPGYRITAGYFRAPRFWELSGEYTFIHINGSQSVNRPSENDRYLTPTFEPRIDSPIERATSDIHLHYKMFNLTANRVFVLKNNAHFRLKLGASVCSAWLHQRWRVGYIDAAREASTINNRWQYWGVGFRLNLGFDWFWGNDFYVTGKFTTALLTGHYKNHAKYESSRDSGVPYGNSRYNDYRVTLNPQFILGPSYQKSIGSMRIEVFAGYEMTLWTNLQEIVRSSRSSGSGEKVTLRSRGDVAIQGLTTRLSLNF